MNETLKDLEEKRKVVEKDIENLIETEKIKNKNFFKKFFSNSKKGCKSVKKPKNP